MSTPGTLISGREAIYIPSYKVKENKRARRLDTATSTKDISLFHSLQKREFDPNKLRAEWPKSIRMQQAEERENRNVMSLQRGEAIRHREIHTAGPSVSTQDLLLDPESFKMDRDRREKRRKATLPKKSHRSIRPPLETDLQEMKAISQQISLKSHRKKQAVVMKKLPKQVSLETIEMQESTLLRSLSTLLDGRSKSVKNMAQQETDEFATVNTKNEKDFSRKWKKKPTPYQFQMPEKNEPEVEDIFRVKKNKEKLSKPLPTKYAQAITTDEEDSDSSGSDSNILTTKNKLRRSKTAPATNRRKKLPFTSTRKIPISSRSMSRKGGNVPLKKVASNDPEWWKLHLRERFVQTGNLLDKLMLQRISFEKDFQSRVKGKLPYRVGETQGLIVNSSLIQPVLPMSSDEYKPKSTKTIVEVGKACFNGICPIEEQVEEFERSFKERRTARTDHSVDIPDPQDKPKIPGTSPPYLSNDEKLLQKKIKKMKQQNIDTLFQDPEVLLKQFKDQDDAANKLATKQRNITKPPENPSPNKFGDWKMDKNRNIKTFTAARAKKIDEMREEMLKMKNEMPNYTTPTELIVAPAHQTFASMKRGKTTRVERKPSVRELLTAPLFFDEDRDSPRTSNTFLDHLQKVNSVKKILTQKFGLENKEHEPSAALKKLQKAKKQKTKENTKLERKSLGKEIEPKNERDVVQNEQVIEDRDHNRRMSMDLKRWLEDVQGKRTARRKAKHEGRLFR